MVRLFGVRFLVTLRIYMIWLWALHIGVDRLALWFLILMVWWLSHRVHLKDIEYWNLALNFRLFKVKGAFSRCFIRLTLILAFIL